MIVVVDYGMGNIASVVNMGRKAGGEFTVSSDPSVVATADKLVLPGVGLDDVKEVRSHPMALPQCRAWLDANCEPDSTTVYVGIDWSEQHRMAAVERNYLPYTAKGPLWVDATADQLEFGVGSESRLEARPVCVAL